MDSSSDEGPAVSRRRMDSSDDEGPRERGDTKWTTLNSEGREESKLSKSKRKRKKEKKKKKKKMKRKDRDSQSNEERLSKKKKRRKHKRRAPDSENPEAYARLEKLLAQIDENPDPEFIQKMLTEDVEFAAAVARNPELAAALAEKANAHEEKQEAAVEEEEEKQSEPEPGPETKMDLSRAKMAGCGNHPEEVKRAKSFRPLANSKQAKSLHRAAMTLDEWVTKKAELAEAEKERFLAQGNVLGQVKCRFCKGPHWSAACPTLKKHRKKEDSIGGGGGYKKPFWECLKCGAENSNKRKESCYKCGALWRSGWAKSGQSW